MSKMPSEWWVKVVGNQSYGRYGLYGWGKKL